MAKYSVRAKLSTEKSVLWPIRPTGTRIGHCSFSTLVRDKEFNIEALFKALADPTRLRLIKLLGDEEVCVCSCVDVLKTNQSKVSRHLAYLRRAGLVTTRRDGKWVYYRIVNPSNPRASKIIREVREWLSTIP